MVESWSSNSSAIDIMVKADKVKAVKQYLEKAKLSYEIFVENLQRVINEENPELSEEEVALLTGRKGETFLDVFRYRARTPSYL